MKAGCLGPTWGQSAAEPSWASPSPQSLQMDHRGEERPGRGQKDPAAAAGEDLAVSSLLSPLLCGPGNGGRGGDGLVSGAWSESGQVGLWTSVQCYCFCTPPCCFHFRDRDRMEGGGEARGKAGQDPFSSPLPLPHKPCGLVRFQLFLPSFTFPPFKKNWEARGGAGLRHKCLN